MDFSTVSVDCMFAHHLKINLLIAQQKARFQKNTTANTGDRTSRPACCQDACICRCSTQSTHLKLFMKVLLKSWKNRYVLTIVKCQIFKRFERFSCNCSWCFFFAADNKVVLQEETKEDTAEDKICEMYLWCGYCVLGDDCPYADSHEGGESEDWPMPISSYWYGKCKFFFLFLLLLTDYEIVLVLWQWMPSERCLLPIQLLLLFWVCFYIYGYCKQQTFSVVTV